jgi:mRNA interferase RelE/StbE
MLKIDPSKQALKFLEHLTPKNGRKIAAKLFQLRQDPYPGDAKQLKGQPYWRATAGEYRIIYRVEGDTLRVVLIGKRNDDEVYRELRRRS